MKMDRNSCKRLLQGTYLPAIIIASGCLTHGCGVSDKATSEATSLDYGPQIAIAEGVYAIGMNPVGETIPVRTLCASDNSRPILSPKLSATANMGQLVKFGDITAVSMLVTIQGTNITKVWSRTTALATIFPSANTAFPSGSTTCSATWSGTIAKNVDGVFQENGPYQVAWSPAHCEFEVHNYNASGGSPATGAWIPNSSFNTILATSAATTKQDGWDVTHSEDTYTLTMPDSVAASQTGYSCADGTNVVKMVWIKQP